MSQNVIPVYKPIGETPYQTVQKFKKKYSKYQNEKVSYAGRLDPMAEGVLLLLIGNENKNRNQYEKLSKTYLFQLLIGVSTDSFDTLGIVTNLSKNICTNDILHNFDTALQNLQGNRLQSYPPYSAVSIHGKPLYYYTRHNLLNKITIPQHNIIINKLKRISNSIINSEQLRQMIIPIITKIQGNFRQEKILRKWLEVLKEKSIFPIITCECHCSSGTYIRMLTKEISDKLNIPITTLTIVRTQVENYDVQNVLHL